jgi:hypothetical protein
MTEQDKHKADQKNQPKKSCCDSNEQSADKATAVRPEPKHDNAGKAQQKPERAPQPELKKGNESRPQYPKPGNDPKPQQKR